MNGILKQRLVGALVLIALAVIFWPVIFVEPLQEPMDRNSRVPPMPAYPKKTVELPRPVEGLEAPGSVPRPDPAEELPVIEEMPELYEVTEASAGEPESEVAAPEPQAVVEPPETAEKPALDSRGIPIAWVVQVATLSQKDKAEALRGQLQDMGYKAGVKAVSRGGRDLYKVFVGPRFDKQAVEEIKVQVDRKFRVKSVVSRYLP